MEPKFTPEQIDKLKACKTVEEAKVFAEETNVELTDEILSQVAGGDNTPNIPRLFSKNGTKPKTTPEVQWLPKE